MPSGQHAGSLLMAQRAAARPAAVTPDGAVNGLLQNWKRDVLAAGELSGRRLGQGLESDLTEVLESRDLWVYSAYGNLDALFARVNVGVPVLVGLQGRADRPESRFVALVTSMNGGAVTWQAGGQAPVTELLETFQRRWRPVSFWMMTACPAERVTWKLTLPEQAVRARLLERTGQPQGALLDYEALVAARPRDAGLWTELGGVRRQLGQPEAAEAAYRQAVALRPDDAQPLNNLAYQLAEEGRDLDYAEQLARRSAQLEPTSPAFLDTLGFVLLKRGRFEEAERVLQRACVLAAVMPAPQRCQIALRLARVQYARGDVQRARALVNQALSEVPGLDVPADLRLLLNHTTAAL